ncbi:hypothetical protein EW145_g1382 [Phellinidium pouzarii]|uniref:Uncharacterized protein n=1 Tax=Phellinidium pouzarii TaxID=167371 RepID=A0A4S4LEY7_9AGAM|nr:hypothetical protein EW145_g1382 [Phellinidium pouzarii]
MDSLVLHTVFVFVEDFGATLRSEGVATWMESEEALQLVIFALVFTLGHLLKSFDHSLPIFVFKYLAFNAYFGALSECAWPGNHVYTGLIRSDSELGVFPKLLAITVSIPFASIAHDTIFNIILQLPKLFWDLQHVIVHFFETPVLSVIGLINSTRLCAKVNSMPLQLLGIIKPIFAAVRNIPSVILGSNPFSMCGFSRAIIKTLSLLHAASSLAKSLLFAIPMEILSKVFLQMLPSAIKFISRSILSCLELVEPGILKFAKIISYLCKSAINFIFIFAGRTSRKLSYFLVIPHPLAKRFVGAVASILSRIVNGFCALPSTAITLLLRLRGLVNTYIKISLQSCEASLNFSIRILRICFKATAPIARTSSEIGERSLAHIKHTPTILRKYVGIFSDLLLYSAFGNFAESCRNLSSYTKSTAVKALSAFAGVCIRFALHSLNLISSMFAEFVSVVKHAMTITFWTAVEFGNLLVQAPLFWRSIKTKAVWFGGLATQFKSFASRSVENIQTISKRIPRILFKISNIGAVQLNVFARHFVHHFASPIEKILSLQRCQTKWEAFRTNLAYISLVLVSYIVLFTIARYFLERKPLRQSAELKDISETRRNLDIFRIHNVPERELCSSPGVQTNHALQDTFSKVRRVYSAAAYCAAAIAPDFIACGGLKRLIGINHEFYITLVRKLESKIHKSEGQLCGQGVDGCVLAEETDSNRANAYVRHSLGVSYVFELVRGLQAARLESERESMDLESLSQMWAGVKIQHLDKLKKDIGGRSLYTRLYDGDVDPIDFLGVSGLSEHADPASPPPLVPSSSSSTSAFSLREEDETSMLLRQALENELRALAHSQINTERNPKIVRFHIEKEPHFKNAPQSLESLGTECHDVKEYERL